FDAQATSRNISTNQYFINYNITFIRRQLSVFTNLNNTTLKGQGISNRYTGVTLGGNATLLKQKMQTGLSVTLTDALGNGQKSYILNGSGNLGYLMSKSQRLGLTLFLTNNNTNTFNALQSNFTETRAELSYQFKF